MKRRLIVALILLVILIVLGVFLYKRYVTDAIIDWGGMERALAQYETVEDREEAE